MKKETRGRKPKPQALKFRNPRKVTMTDAQFARISRTTSELKESDANFLRASSLFVADGIEKGTIDLDKFLEYLKD